HGEVMIALDVRAQRRVAIKRLRALATYHVQRIKREFRTIASLHHPNLVRVDELWVDGDDAFIAMELVEGRNLIEHLQAAPDDLPALLAQLCSALQALHGAGIVHRDLKPAHVLVTSDGALRLIDFSIAARAGEPAERAGTERYRAPEAA